MGHWAADCPDHAKMFAQLAKFTLLAAVISPVIVISPLEVSFGKCRFFRIVVEIAAILALMSWGLQEPPFSSKGRASRLRHPVVVAVTAFVGVFLLATLFAFDRAAAFWSTYARGEGGFQMLHYCVFLLLLIVLYREPGDWERIFLVSLAAGGFAILYGFAWAAGWPAAVIPIDSPIDAQAGFWQQLLGHQFVASIGNSISTGSYFLFQLSYIAWLLAGRCSAPVALTISGAGGFLAVSVYAAIALLLQGHDRLGAICLVISILPLLLLRRTLQVTRKPAALMISGFTGSSLFFFAFLLTMSRGPALGLIVALVAATSYVAYKRWKWWIVVILGSGALLGIGLYYLQPTAILGSLQGKNVLDITSLTYRLQYWHVAWLGFLHRPILGWGPENFTTIYDRYGQVLWWVNRPRHPIPRCDLSLPGQPAYGAREFQPDHPRGHRDGGRGQEWRRQEYADQAAVPVV